MLPLGSQGLQPPQATFQAFQRAALGEISQVAQHANTGQAKFRRKVELLQQAEHLVEMGNPQYHRALLLEQAGGRLDERAPGR
jgi:adenylosuccinate lyase